MVLKAFFVGCLLISLTSSNASAQAERDDAAMAEYLGLLDQIAPPAREGAEAFMAAFRRKCGRDLRSSELRRAVADGNGNPVLMQMMRAKHDRNESELARLAGLVECRP